MIILLIVLIILIYSYFIYKKLIELNNKTNELYKKLDQSFKKRIEYLPNIIKICKQYSVKTNYINKMNNLLNDYEKQSIFKKIKIQEELNNIIDEIYYDVNSNVILKENLIFINVIKKFNVIEEEIFINANNYNYEIKKYNKIFKYNRLIGLLLNFNYKYVYNIDEDSRIKIGID